MNKLHILEKVLQITSITVILMVVFNYFILPKIYSPNIDKLIEMEFNKQASKLMEEEIIKQLREKGTIK